MLNDYLDRVNGFMYGKFLIFLLIIAGLFMTFLTRGVQIRLFGDAVKSLLKKEGEGVSSLQALMISTSSRVGTGNIAGVATAIVAGGPGAVFWMWLIAVIGSASAFVESLLAQTYKIPDVEDPGYRGGPAYYLKNALHMPLLGSIFSVVLILTFAFGFNALQAYNISSSFYAYVPEYGSTMWPYVVGLILAALSLWVYFGGNERVGKVTSFLMPVMAAIYIGLGLIIIVINIRNFPEMISTIFKSAFNGRAVSGGLLGGVMLMGIKRGLFSNEAGMGSAPNAAAAAKVKHPVNQALVQVVSVFIDTLILCSVTAFMVLITNSPDGTLNGIPLVQRAVESQIGRIGIHIITVCIFLFAYSSIVGNMYYAESNFKFLTVNTSAMTVFRIVAGIAVFLGAIGDFAVVWNIADILMGIMAAINIFAIFLLSGTALKVLRDYERQKKESVEPEFNALENGIENTYYWRGNLDND